MNTNDLIKSRLYSQQISHPTLKAPAEVVEWLGAVQSQDYGGSKWSIASRLPGATDSDIEAAVAKKEIVRTWAFRGTLHFLAAKDIYWMLSFLKPRLAGVMGTHFRKLELDKPILNKSRKILEQLLKDGKQLTRKEISSALEKKKIATNDMRMTFILLDASFEGLICFGERRAKEFTHTLLEEWVRPTSALQYDEALAELTRRYFTSHGPATMQDFSWWSGLTLSDVKRGLAIVADGLHREKINKQDYWMSLNASSFSKTNSPVFLLAGFDEYVVAYKDRSAILLPNNVKAVMGSGNGIFSNTVLVGGKIAGTWRREFKKDSVVITISTFDKNSDAVNRKIATAAKRYGKFLEMPVVIC